VTLPVRSDRDAVALTTFGFRHKVCEAYLPLEDDTRGISMHNAQCTMHNEEIKQSNTSVMSRSRNLRSLKTMQNAECRMKELSKANLPYRRVAEVCEA